MARTFARLLCLFTLIGAIALVLPVAPTARAENVPPAEDPAREDALPLDIDFSVSPGELVAPGDVTMTFIITNRSNAEAQNVYISSADGLLSESIGQIGAGETQTLVRPHAVTQEELDAGEIRYNLSYDAPQPGGEKITRALTAPITKGDARPDVDFTRQLSSVHVTPGAQLTVTYKLANNGNVPASDIVVRDSLGDFTGRLEWLDVGATKTFISRVIISAEAVTEASLEYTVPSGETFKRKLDPVDIHLSNSALESSFSVGRSVFDPDRADAILTLTNTGTDSYADITVIDDVYGGVIADSIVLPGGGQPVEISYTYPVRGSGEYRWRVTGVSQAGEVLDFVTETAALTDEPGPRSIGIQLRAAARTPRINRAGRVTFDIELQNTGTEMAENLLLYEVNRGDVRQLAVLPAGDPARIQATYEVNAPTQFIFCVNYTDSDGRPRTISSAPVDVEIVAGGEDPERERDESIDVNGGSTKMGATSTFAILLAVASAALVSMFTILLVTSLRARRDRRMRIAAEKKRIKEELGKTNPFTPVKGAPPRQPRSAANPRPGKKKKPQQ